MSSADEFINACLQEVGSDATEYNQAYGYSYETPWCANFLSYVSVRILNYPWHESASAAGFATQFERIDDSEVRAGDVVTFNWDGRDETGWCDHVALVTDFDHNTDLFNTVDGNSTGGRVATNTYNNNSYYRTYFYRPSYDNCTGGGYSEPEYEGPGAVVFNDETGSGVVYQVHTQEDGWLDEVCICAPNEDIGYAGWLSHRIDGIKAYRVDRKPLRLQVCMSDGEWLDWTTFNGSLFGENSSGDGYSGDIDSGKFIIGIRCDGAYVRSSCGGDFFGWSTFGETTVCGDDFSGDDLNLKRPIIGVQMMCLC